MEFSMCKITYFAVNSLILGFWVLWEMKVSSTSPREAKLEKYKQL